MSDSSFDILSQILQGSSTAADWVTNMKLQQQAAAAQQTALDQAKMQGYNQAQAASSQTNSGQTSSSSAFNMFMKAIAQQESGGNYKALGDWVGGDRAYGKYQVMGNNIPTWTQAALGTSMTPQQYLQDKQAQDAVAQHYLGQYFRQYGPRQAAMAWNQGVAGMQSGYGTDYAHEVMDRMRSYGFTKGMPQNQPGASGTSAGYGRWINPLQNMPANTSSGYGYRINPITGLRSFHEGADYAAALGTPVQAAMGGKIVQAGWDPIYGNQVIIRNNGIKTMYGHLNQINPKWSEGDFIDPGQRIGQVGSTGWSTGPHLHFGVYQGGMSNPVNPSEFFNGDLRQGWSPSRSGDRSSGQATGQSTGQATGDSFRKILNQLGL